MNNESFNSFSVFIYSTILKQTLAYDWIWKSSICILCIKATSLMITDPQTNFLYLADSLPKQYPDFYLRFEKILTDSKIDFALLPNTKDIWAVDYMPIQIELNQFVRFTYNPSYLQKKKYLKTISDVDTICKDIGIDTRKTDILLDGGNVIRWKNKVIMSDKVFSENPGYERKQLIKELHDLLEIDQLFLIPAQPGDFTDMLMVWFVSWMNILFWWMIMI